MSFSLLTELKTQYLVRSNTVEGRFLPRSNFYWMFIEIKIKTENFFTKIDFTTNLNCVYLRLSFCGIRLTAYTILFYFLL